MNLLSAARNDTAEAAQPFADDMVWLQGGPFLMGSNDHYVEERPAHKVSVHGFFIDRHPVTNRQFARFVEETNYKTQAERAVDPALYPGAAPHLLLASSLVFVQPPGPVDRSDLRNWWHYLAGADWRHPQGPASNLDGREDHPVVQVGHADALAYAQWCGKRLPTEAEWEYAARGGRTSVEFAWGDQLVPDGRYMANTWQGEFPWENLALDGHQGTSPVGSYPANDYGLFDMIGNVWEWTSDWYQDHGRIGTHACCTVDNPRGADRHASVDPHAAGPKVGRRVTKGGSHLCAPSYCRRYRPAARMPQAIDTATCHLGFRCVMRRP
jgi:formylglycine-generating enzyme required for sulfatase activity